ncbi:odorant receptor 174 [Tribolium castaneum]|uniref:Odorant receptor n=1 Tax=Tribolium castaneum TaxID=7070 RepID=D6WEN7_TRICA|nr:odorant receptor 174 [Tribolium castaneum]
MILFCSTLAKMSNVTFDEPFMFFKKVFFDFGYNKIIKFYNLFCFTLHLCCIITEHYFFLTKYLSADFVTLYGCATILIAYIIVCQYFVMRFEKPIKQLFEERETIFWKIDSDQKAKTQIIKFAAKITRIYKFFFVWVVVLVIVMLPFWGEIDKSFLIIRVQETLFGKWSIIFYCIYVSTFPFLIYSSVRLPMITFYLILQAHLQILILNQKIVQIPQNDNLDLDAGLQKKIYTSLKLCMSRHVSLKRWMSEILQIVRRAIPIFFCLSIICSVTVIFFILNYLENSNTSNLLKIRLVLVGICVAVVLYTYSEAGQLLSDDTSQVFDTLATCSWYEWDTKNRKMLLMFLLHSLKPIKFYWGGFALDYRFGGSVVRTTFSYALVLYNLRKSS